MYDAHFIYSTARFVPQLHWRQLWAQGVQESALDPEAVSSAGARGIMQLMPATFDACRKALRFGQTSIHSPKASILCGGWYMKYQYGQWWRHDRTVTQKWRLALAGYNAGLGNILAAQRRCNETLWYAIEPCLSAITGRHATETRLYVRRVERIWLDTL